MDLTQIRYFLALSKTLNFTRAAEACNVTQPALTKSIQRLEEEMGGRLLLRERANTQLTPLGAVLLPLLTQTYEAAETARAQAAAFRREPPTRLRIGFCTAVEPFVIAPLLRAVAWRFPALALTTMHGDAAALNAALLNSEMDIVLTADVQRLTERANRWPIFADPIVIAMHSTHALACAACVPETALADHRWISRSLEGAGAAACRMEARFVALPPATHRSGSEAHVHAWLLAGMGVALSTGRALLPADLVRRPIDPVRELQIHVAALAGRPLAGAADAFLRLARARDWASETA